MKKSLPYLQKDRGREGKVMWYVRRDHGPRIRIRGEYGTAEFFEAYQAALAGRPIDGKAKKCPAQSGTLQWAFDQYRGSSEWAALSISTQVNRERMMRPILARNGHLPYLQMSRQHIIEGREKRKHTPGTANDYLKAMRSLFKWLVDRGLIEVSPAENVAGLKINNKGITPWTLDDVEKYRTRWPLGTPQCLALELLLSTGLRRSDAVRLGRPHLKAGSFAIKTVKTKEWVYPLLLSNLAAAIDAGPCGDLTYITNADGRPMSGPTFTNWFTKHARVAGVNKSPHGLRKLAATIAAENGASDYDLMSWFGWRSNSESQTYTRGIRRQMLSAELGPKMEPSMRRKGTA